MTVTIRLPEPPTANHHYSSVVVKGRARHILSAEGRQYKQDVTGLWLQRPVASRILFPATVPLSVRLAWHRGRKSGDLDNRIKPAMDSLKGLAFVDDSQIAEIHATRHESPRNAYIDVTIEPLSPDDT